MKQKFLTLFLVIILLLLSTSVAFAGAKNSWFAAWSWQGEKSGYFQTTGSDIVHMWSYDRPNDEPDIHFVIKPLDKFPDASCDEGAIKDSPTWIPKNLYNALYSEYKTGYKTIFPDLYRVYQLCGYPID